MTAISATPGLDRDHSESFLPDSPVPVVRIDSVEDVTGPRESRWTQMCLRAATAVKARAGQLFKQFRTILRALRHPGVPWYAKAVCGCAVLYVASPIQIIPNFIPVIGQLDDVLVITLSLKLLKRCVPPEVLDECRKNSQTPVTPETPLNIPISPSNCLSSEGSHEKPLS